MTGPSAAEPGPAPRSLRERRRLALVLARHSAALGAPPGVDRSAFARACLADSYEVLADLVGVDSGIVGGVAVDDLLWPGAVRVEPGPIRGVVAAVGAGYAELVLLPADVPDLPGLVVAKLFQALQRADVSVAPERGRGGGVAAYGVRLPWPSWLPDELDLDRDLVGDLSALAPRRSSLAVGPDWHRMRTSTAVSRLDPRLEGWEMTRSLLTGRVLG